ncbi:MAG: hypothetical protein WCK51_06275 [Armatimonadota bacterium]
MSARLCISLPTHLTRSFILEHSQLPAGVSIEVKVPAEFAVEPLCEGVAIQWVQYLKREGRTIHLNFQSLPEEMLTDEMPPTFLTSGFGFALVFAAKTFSQDNKQLDREDHVRAPLVQQHQDHRDRLSYDSGWTLVCKFPIHPLPFPLRQLKNSSDESTSTVSWKRLNQLFESLVLNKQYGDQRQLGVNELPEILYQALQNATEEHDICLKSRAGSEIFGHYCIFGAKLKSLEDANSDILRDHRDLFKGVASGAPAYYVGVADIGRGIPNSFREANQPANVSDLADFELVKLAFTPGTTTKAQPGRKSGNGYGLSSLVEASEVLHATVIVDTPGLTTIVRCYQNGTEIRDRFVPLDGTSGGCLGTSITVLWQK